MKPDGIWGGGASYRGKTSCPVVDVARDDRIKGVRVIDFIVLLI
jgi:hypothetical protein